MSQTEDIRRSDVEPCLYNWLGYGNPNSPYWFMGTEEGGAEIWRKQKMTGQPNLTVKESLALRAGFGLSADFPKVWEGHYGLPLELFKGATVWRYIAAFVYALEGKDPEAHKAELMPYVKHQLGRPDASHFLGEFLSLPKVSAGSIEPYEAIWPSVAAYRREVEPGRMELIRKTLAQSLRASTLICYDRSLTAALLKGFDADHQAARVLEFQQQRYVLTSLRLGERTLFLFQTPFFGQGQISYAGIRAGAEFLKQALRP